jgi:hypothetical protein
MSCPVADRRPPSGRLVDPQQGLLCCQVEIVWCQQGQPELPSLSHIPTHDLDPVKTHKFCLVLCLTAGPAAVAQGQKSSRSCVQQGQPELPS